MKWKIMKIQLYILNGVFRHQFKFYDMKIKIVFKNGYDKQDGK